MHPNLLFVFADQLRAASAPPGEPGTRLMPHVASLAREGVTFTQAISTCPLCTPYRSMLLTGRHPQTTGHVCNFVATRPDEISIGDAFARAGYRTGWVGKWHLAVGHFSQPHHEGVDYIPEGRDRLGFEYFRGYNYHTRYFDGWLCKDDWNVEQWKGYETEGVPAYAREFLQRDDGRPFCLFVSVHPPHQTAHRPWAPEECYARVPRDLPLAPNVAEKDRTRALEMNRHYLAMTAAVDDMVGALLSDLDRAGRAADTLVVFTSDHGTMGGGHGFDPWCKKQPYEESIHVPLAARLPGKLRSGTTCDALVAPVDLFPTLAGICGVPVPQCVEGMDLSAAWLAQPGASRQDAVLTMDFTTHPDLPVGPNDPRRRPYYEPWRGVRTPRHHLIRWLDGRTALFDLERDPYQLDNLAGRAVHAALQASLERQLDALLAKRGDRLQCSSKYADWFDSRRRIVRNAFGPLPHPDSPPDWSLFGPGGTP
jgi:arylsulfatase A-like enzyme